MILEGGEGGLSEVVTNGTSLLFVRGGLLLLEGGPETNMKEKRNTFLIHPPIISRYETGTEMETGK